LDFYDVIAHDPAIGVRVSLNQDPDLGEGVSDSPNVLSDGGQGFGGLAISLDI
jgi:hypothetical protein